MSCHYIGHAAIFMIEGILEAFDNREMSLPTAKKLAYRAYCELDFCDGNPNEATEVFKKQHRCGCCFRILPVEQLVGLDYLESIEDDPELQEAYENN